MTSKWFAWSSKDPIQYFTTRLGAGHQEAPPSRHSAWTVCMLINPAAEFAYVKHFFWETICKRTPKTKTQRVRERQREMEWRESTNRWQAVLLRLGRRRVMPETLEPAKTGGALQEASTGKELRRRRRRRRRVTGHTLTLSHSSSWLHHSSGSCFVQKPEDAADLQLIKALFCFLIHFCFFLCLLPDPPPFNFS